MGRAVDSGFPLRAPDSTARNPTFALVVILTLAVAIGMNTAIFSVFNAVVLRPLGYPDADRLVWLSTTSSDAEPGLVTARTSPIGAAKPGRSSAWWRTRTPITRWYLPRGASRVRAAMVTEDFWDLSGAKTRRRPSAPA